MLIDPADPLWPRVVAAFAAVQGPVPQGLTPGQFAQNAVMAIIKATVKKYESELALMPSVDAQVAAKGKVDADFDVQFVKVP